jgi:hypothetical protein
MRQTTSADTNLILAAVSGRSFGTKLYKTKGCPWPFYYGIQPTGRYPDEPFVKELYYDGANPIILHRVPEPRVRVPNTPQVVRTPPPQPIQTPNTAPIIGITDCIP